MVGRFFFGVVLLCVLGCGDDAAVDAGRDATVDAVGADTATDAPGVDAPGVDATRDDTGVAPGVVWFSDWRNGTGTEQTALYDGDKWNGQLCAADVAEVVDAAGLDFPTANVYRSDYDVPGNCLMVQVTDAWAPPAPGEYMFVRAYYRNAMPDGTEIGFPHPLHIGRSASADASYSTWFNFSGPEAGVSGMSISLGGGPEYPDRFWGWGFQTNTTYRLEVRIHRVTADQARVDVRVYDTAGTLVADSDDWNNGETEDHPQFRTLAGSAPTYPVNDESFTLLELGNNDPAGLVAGSGRYVYWGALAVVVSADPDAWPGAYPSPAER